jgi:hypothetical protein
VSYSAVQPSGMHWFGVQMATFCVAALEQHVAPAPHAPLPGVQERYVMQMPTPEGSRSLSHDVPILHSPPFFVHGAPIPLQLPAVGGHVVPAGGVQSPLSVLPSTIGSPEELVDELEDELLVDPDDDVDEPDVEPLDAPPPSCPPEGVDVEDEHATSAKPGAPAKTTTSTADVRFMGRDASPSSRTASRPKSAECTDHP